MKEVRSPTNMVWVIGRTETNGKSDYTAVHAVQNQYALTRLSSWGAQRAAPEEAAVDPTTDTKSAPVEQVARMDAATFFRRLNALMASNPPSAADAPLLGRLASVGVGPGVVFAGDIPEPALEAGVCAARDRLIAAAARQQGESLNGWNVSPSNTGRYGTDYLSRAVVALTGLGANLREDAMYLRSRKDADGERLDGAHKYVVRFARGLPPVGAFWSIAMYDGRQRFVENVLDRYSIGDRDNLTFGNDGSLTLYIQHESPGIAHSSNWLPAPAAPFNLIMRLYRPSKAILDGIWKPPAVERVSETDVTVGALNVEP
jgi:hypothetical protein